MSKPDVLAYIDLDNDGEKAIAIVAEETVALKLITYEDGEPNRALGIDPDEAEFILENRAMWEWNF